jgi:type VI secretion system ImpC/EvpB family protein
MEQQVTLDPEVPKSGRQLAPGNGASAYPVVTPESVLDEFLREPSPAKALGFWVARRAPNARPTREQIARLLSRDIARLDALLSRQVNAILHHPDFQRLEASWRGLRYLTEQAPEGENVKIRVLNVSWKELTRDLERALEFDQSQLFRKVYSEEFGTPGGQPFSVLLGDYEIRLRPSPEQPTDDVAALARISSVAAAAFAPFLVAAHPALLDLTSFTELDRPLNLARTFEQVDYVKWRALRQTEDARFVGLVLPRVLMRMPYGDEPARVDGFRFREDADGPDRARYLWGNAVYAFGSVVMRAFSESGWLADIRGVPRDGRGGGLVSGLPVQNFATDGHGVAAKPSVEAVLSDVQEKALSELGLIPLCHCPDTEVAAFYGNQSLQQPKTYDEPAAMSNARLSAMLQYMLCVARFAHYVKVIARDKVGAFAGPADWEDFLQRWLLRYTLPDEAADLETKARFPLQEAKVQVRAHPGKPGSYLCVVHLRPHFQLDQVATAVRLATELAPAALGPR